MTSFFEIQDEPFQEWVKTTENAFVRMIETMVDVAKVVREETIPLTPVETTRLGQSFKWKILTDNSRMKVLEVQMSALNPKTGYDYAWIQHENTRYRHTAFLKGSWKASKVHGFHNVQWFNAQDHYLRQGIRNSEDMAIELIEEDYLSLFRRGDIY